MKSCSSYCKHYVIQRLGKTCNFVNRQNLEKSVIVLLLLLSSGFLHYYSQIEYISLKTSQHLALRYPVRNVISNWKYMLWQHWKKKKPISLTCIYKLVSDIILENLKDNDVLRNRCRFLCLVRNIISFTL